MKELVEESIDILASGTDIGAFGDLLHEAWQAKRSLSSAVSNGEVDALYERARSAGALGGKLTGAGGGGFLLLFVAAGSTARPSSTALDGRIHVPFEFESGGQPDHLLRAGGGLPGSGSGAAAQSRPTPSRNSASPARPNAEAA